MILLILLSPVIQVIAQKEAGDLRPHFVPNVPFFILIVATWGLFRRKGYVRAYVYSLAVLKIVGPIVLFFVSDVPYLPYQVGALLALLIQDVPLCSYFTWSRRARVTLECRVRSDDPFLSAKGVASIQNDARSADRTKSLASSAIDHAESQSAAPSQDHADLERQRKFDLLLQYSPPVRDAYQAISHLPGELKQRFRAAVLEPGGHHEAKSAAARLLDEHRRRSHPFQSAEANDFLARARNLGSAAEKEFTDVMGLLGSSASPSEVFDNVNSKYGLNAILGNVQKMLAYLEKNNCVVRVVEGKFFATIYSTKHPKTCEPTFGDADTLQAFCRRVWEQRLNPNSQT